MLQRTVHKTYGPLLRTCPRVYRTHHLKDHTIVYRGVSGEVLQYDSKGCKLREIEGYDPKEKRKRWKTEEMAQIEH